MAGRAGQRCAAASCAVLVGLPEIGDVRNDVVVHLADVVRNQRVLHGAHRAKVEAVRDDRRVGGRCRMWTVR